MTALAPLDVQVWLHTLRDEEYARHTLQGARAILKAALDQVEDLKLITRNPVPRVKLPPMAGTPKVKPLSIVELRCFLAATKDDRLAAIWWVVLLGLRRG